MSSSKKLVTLGAGSDKRADSQDFQSNIKLSYLFKSESGDNRLYLNVRVFGGQIKALLDSGATHTVLGANGMWIIDRFSVRLRSTPT